MDERLCKGGSVCYHPQPMNFCPRRTARDSIAFTLIELLVVIAIVVVLASFLLPVFGSAKEQANVLKTMSNMKQVGVAFLSYANDNNYLLPNRVADGVNDPKWPTLLQPYLQNLGVYGSPIPDAQGKTYRVTNQTDYLNNGANYTSYIYNGMNDLGAHGNATVAVRLNNIGQASETILLGVPYPQANNFYMDFNDRDNDLVLNKKAFDSTRSVYMFCDGSSRVLTCNSDSAAYNTQRPPNSGTYTDWLWLFDKADTAAIQ